MNYSGLVHVIYHVQTFTRLPWRFTPTLTSLSPGDVICFNTFAEEFAFWGNTVMRSINETISTKFQDPKELDEFYSRMPETDAKLDEFGQRCLASKSGPYLKYIGTSSTIRDLVSLADKIVGPGQPIDYYGYSYGTIIGFHFLSRESVDPLCSSRWLILTPTRTSVFPDVSSQPPKSPLCYPSQYLIFPEARRPRHPRWGCSPYQMGELQCMPPSFYHMFPSLTPFRS